MRLAVVLAVALLPAVLAGCTAGASEAGAGDGQDLQSAAHDSPANQADRREFMLLPGEVVSLEVATPGGESLHLVLLVYQGFADATVEGPGDCRGMHGRSLTVSGSGAGIETEDCGEVAAGRHPVQVRAGPAAAFRGALEVRGGRFA